jgi:hypothetical protein
MSSPLAKKFNKTSTMTETRIGKNVIADKITEHLNTQTNVFITRSSYEGTIQYLVTTKKVKDEKFHCDYDSSFVLKKKPIVKFNTLFISNNFTHAGSDEKDKDKKCFDYLE